MRFYCANNKAYFLFSFSAPTLAPAVWTVAYYEGALEVYKRIRMYYFFRQAMTGPSGY